MDHIFPGLVLGISDSCSNWLWLGLGPGLGLRLGLGLGHLSVISDPWTSYTMKKILSLSDLNKIQRKETQIFRCRLSYLKVSHKNILSNSHTHTDPTRLCYEVHTRIYYHKLTKLAALGLAPISSSTRAASVQPRLEAPISGVQPI